MIWAGASCTPDLPPVVAESRYIRFATDEPDEICPGTLERMDAFIEGVYADLDLDPPQGYLATYYWMPDGADDPAFPCIDGALACADPGRVFTPLNYDTHELAHTVHFHLWGDSISLLAEGFAERYRAAKGMGSVHGELLEPVDIADLARYESADRRLDRVSALMFSNAVIDDYGPDLYGELFSRAKNANDPSRFADVVEEVTGDTVDAIVERQVGSLICDRQIATCNSPTLPWSGDTWTLPDDHECDSPLVWGPVDSTRRRERRAVFELDAEVEIEISAGGLGLEIAPCVEACNWLRSIYQWRSDETPVRQVLGPGRYEAVQQFDDDTGLEGATLTRIDP